MIGTTEWEFIQKQTNPMLFTFTYRYKRVEIPENRSNKVACKSNNLEMAVMYTSWGEERTTYCTKQ